ncbi:MAG: hypothetical protein M0R46_11920 [Candidatus Muirbacterium halophilum]|nr:hypothetical protein [Candidatus Muirbacterium halophilum]MCK9476622.1 hypothetical protein [Candidatus Muirbacterium halophilum]
MKNIKLSELILLIILSISIIPAISLKNSINTRVDTETTDQFTSSILMLDLFEKSTHNVFFDETENIKWNPKYFAKFVGKIITNEEENDKKITIEIKWQKSQGNFLEFESFTTSTNIFLFNELRGSFYE